MKYFIKLLLLIALISVYTHARSSIISPVVNIDSPVLVTSTTQFEVDFDMPGSLITLQDLQLTFNFSNNLFGSFESLGFEYLADITNPPPGLTSPAWLAKRSATGVPLSTLSISANNMHINESGIGLFTLNISGDGTIIDSVSLTGNASIATVPLPPALLLFIFGLFALLIPKTLTNRLWTPQPGDNLVPTGQIMHKCSPNCIDIW